MSLFIVVKIGGNLLRPNALGESFFSDLESMSRESKIVLIHGGGPQMNEAARALGHVPIIKHGRRVTGKIDLEIVERVLGQELNRQLVDDFNRRGLSARGLRGSEDIVLVEKRPPIQIDDELVDFGWVGDVKEIVLDKIIALADQDIIPIIATMGGDSTGQVFNVNGDTVSAEIAQALGASKLIFVTEVGQVLNHERRTLSEIDHDLFQKGVNQKWIEGGMRVKVDLGLRALKSGRVNSVFICGPEDIANPDRSTQISS